ncbi:proline racemase family protein [Salsuginibacillus kocurii]|uniref:proline racemase family protein n=1 Tax=Salsuginibacillus kocurii TaxID=427078 RepID=UPI00037157A4|nr:proline racemase family protein [Salsuginibacillus kocurii]
MHANKLFRTIDTHTGGNPTRTVVSGLPTLNGETVADKMLDMKENHDWIRKFLMYEPRGHEVMSGALLVDPCHPDADIGVIFIETGGYLPMCGHDTIGVCTALVEAGMIKCTTPVTALTLETPAGIVKVEIEIENEKATKVTFQNIPSFKLKTVEVETSVLQNSSIELSPQHSSITCDIAYGGNFYGIIDAKSLGLRITPDNASEIIETAVTIRNHINEIAEIVHPEHPFIKGLTHIEFSTDPTHPHASVKNAVVVPPGGIDRSPCGTGTSAKLATLYANDSWSLNVPFLHESIVGSLFEASIIEETSVGKLNGIITTISGQAHIMGMHTFVSSAEDELNEGFLLIEEMEVH